MIVACAFVAGAPAAAHDEYWWIEKPQYKSQSGAGCCGPRDCAKVNVLDNVCDAVECVLTIRENDRTTRVRVNRISVYPSEDANSWICRFNSSDHAHAQCAFIGMGM
jgi:hypothetical protein